MSPGGWTAYAETMEEAGADAIELNVYRVATDVAMTGVEIEQGYIDLVSSVRASINIPLAVKISPYFSSTASMCRRLVEAGASGLVLFNRFYQPDINLDELKIKPDIVLSSPVNLRLPLRWTAILRGRIDASLAASSGVHTGEDVVKLVLAGADVTMMTSALLKYGPSHLATVLFEMESWFAEREYRSIEQGKGSLSQASAADPEAFERTNYMRSLVTCPGDPEHPVKVRRCQKQSSKSSDSSANTSCGLPSPSWRCWSPPFASSATRRSFRHWSTRG
jgi:dihydroorotate dehydrogenase (fumarate)